MPTSRRAPASDPDTAADSAPAGVVPAGTDLRLVPTALAGWAGGWVGTSGQLGWQLAGVLAAVVLLALARATRRWARVPAAAALLGCLLVGGLHGLAVGTGPVRTLATTHASADLQLVLLHDPVRVAAPAQPDGADGRAGRTWVRARVVTVHTHEGALRVRAPVLVTIPADQASGWQDAVAGSTLAVRGSLTVPAPGSDLAAMVRASGPPTLLATPSWDQRAVRRVHDGLRAAVADRDPRARALVPALVVGDTGLVDETMETEFRDAGLLHVMAVSGSNLTLLLAFLLTGAKLLGLRGRLLHGVTAAGVVVFIALCRTEPSVLRAAAMGTVALSALMAGAADGPRRGLRSLSVAVLGLLVVDPWLSRSAGFVLSSAATAGIVLWATPWADRMARWAPRWLAEAVCVPLAAQLATGPFAVPLSGSVSAVGLLANMAVGPLVGPATVAGFAAAGLGVVWPQAATVVAWPAALAARAIAAVAATAAGAPGATLWWPPGMVGVLLLGAASAVAVIAAPVCLSRWWAAVLLSVLLLVVVLRGPARPGWPPPDWSLAVCDVGQGNAIVLASGPGEAVLVDTGGDGPAVLGCLRQLGVQRLSLLVLSHLHADHAGALPQVLAQLPVTAVVTAPGQYPRTGTVPHLASSAGDVVRVGTVTWESLAPPPGRPPPADPADENDGSLVGRASIGGLSVLLPGDLQAAGQDRLLWSGVDVRATVLVVPHHGSRDQSREFLRATGARLALVSVGRDNSYGHPHRQTLDTLTGLGMGIVRTDQGGHIAVSCHDDRCRAVPVH
ncbi:ComEC/Rec2 family competence protein [Raineyella sp. W15-4]|uniref:ComEC/Rec2 family competence protein n=1 Tax=Raineyella sp. W15-4 TaxID=3081651 RepID=UPI002955115C|nr:ComEC/Rec2 family competence protein [Raineyella sp. W15-4]WOQ15705.1 ComEC/Rec2 family competence protein [Raineyella sp. W15-4]